MTLEETLDRHRRFWKREGDPLIADLPHPDWKPRPYPLKNGVWLHEPTRIRPEDVDPLALLGSDHPPPAITMGDSLLSVRSSYPVSWMASLLGCPIYASAYSCSAKPVAAGAPATAALADLVDVDGALSSPWLAVMDGFLRLADERAGDELSVCQLHLRGVVDMIAATLGEALMCTSVYDAPEALEELADRLADLYVRVADWVLERRREWRGGYVSSWGIYAPGVLVDYQIDASSIMSPPTYSRHLAPFDKRVLEHFPYRLVHLHACGLHMVDAVLQCPPPLTVEITLERETGQWDREGILDACRAIQQAGCSILLHGELTRVERDELLDDLEPGGLAIFSWLPSGRYQHLLDDA